MKTAITIVLMFALIAMYGCQSSSPRGGSVLKGEGFKIAVPTFSTEIKQGETKNVTVSLERGEYFKKDVKLQIEASKGIRIDPTKVLVKANESADVQLRIATTRDTALGSYHVSVKGTPETGEPTSTAFTVTVVAP